MACRQAEEGHARVIRAFKLDTFEARLRDVLVLQAFTAAEWRERCRRRRGADNAPGAVVPKATKVWSMKLSTSLRNMLALMRNASPCGEQVVLLDVDAEFLGLANLGAERGVRQER